MACRICGKKPMRLLDLGHTPPANWLMKSRDEEVAEFPLRLESCECGNFQLDYCLDAETLYRHYEYVTPRSPILETQYANLERALRAMRALGTGTRVLEIGSNAGLFLEYLAPKVKSIQGVDPAQNIAATANARGIPTDADFFNADYAVRRRKAYGEADLIVARHCMAHNADPYGILDGVIELLSPDGVFVMENAYAINTFENNEFDQIYHEHMFYFTLQSIETMLSSRGLAVQSVVLSDVHGGSIACIAKRAPGEPDPALQEHRLREADLLRGGLAQRFADAVRPLQERLRETVQTFCADGRTVYAYGATAKGATLLNTTGLTYREIPCCADSTPTKVGRFVPKAGVEIIAESTAMASPPAAFLLTAWNYEREILSKLDAAGLGGIPLIIPIQGVTKTR